MNPSAPIANARLLSSSELLPVNAKIFDLACADGLLPPGVPNKVAEADKVELFKAELDC